MTYDLRWSNCHIQGMNPKLGQIQSTSKLKLDSIAANVR